MDILLLVLLVSVIAMGLPLVFLTYTFFKGDRLPESRPAEYLRTFKEEGNKKPVIVFAGDSLTQGTIGVGYCIMLEEIYNSKNVTLLNGGVNGDFAWSVLQRVEEIIQCDPDLIFVLIGSNDALSQLAIRYVWLAQHRKHLPQQPTQEWFEECLRELIKQFQERTSAQIILMSIPPIGEELTSDALQTTTEYSRTIERISLELAVDYLPIHEKMTRYLQANPPRPTYGVDNAVRGMVSAMVRHFVFKKSWDRIAKDSGQVLHVDHIHLNSNGARIIADSVREFMANAGH